MTEREATAINGSITGSLVLATDHPAALARQSGRLALCLQRQAEGQDTDVVLNSWIEAALDRGASLLEQPRLESFGAEAWLLDPEGNRLLLLVLP